MSIELSNIRKAFKTNTELAHETYSKAKGETLVLYGPTGAGKTVL